MVKPTYIMQGGKTLAKFVQMTIEDLCNVFKVEHVTDNGDHFILRVPQTA